MGATILITREEREGDVEIAARMGLELVFVALTRSKMLDAGSWDPPPAPPSDPSFHSGSQGGVSYIAPRTSHIALTSRNAVEALKQANLLNELKGKEIWCIGKSTAAALGDIPCHVSPGTTGEDLARFMLESGVTGDVLHICGNPHRPEFGSRMLEAGCKMQEWVVYETIPINAELPKEKIDAVAFFSPAAVKQFKNLGWTESLQVPYVAIGPTTASELLPCSCLVSSDTTFESVLETSKKMLNVEF
jgi:uroporphyrinogen-III synthase